MLLSQSGTTTFTCPICLDENRVVYTTPDSNDNNKSAAPNAVNESGSPIFELSSCNHKFCAACLRTYVRSKLLDGQVDVPCCHFDLSSFEEDFHSCNVLIPESDIYQLIHSMDDCDETDKDEWCCNKDDHDSSFSSSKESNKDGNAGGEQLWTKYQKLKFDTHHGKDAVRRCPKCDDAQLFDEESMKEFQTKFLTQNDNDSASGSTANNGSNDSTRNVNRLERMFNLFRQRQMQRDPVDITGAAASNEKVDEIIPPPKEEGDVKEKDKPKLEDDIKLSEGVNPTSTSSVDSKDKASNSRDGGGSDASTDGKSSETNQNAAEQKETPLVKSTTPLVTCLTCSTEFCYFHSNAHSGTSKKACVAYHNKSLDLDRANVEYVNTTLHAKPCPTCGISVSKEGGCNQIKCGSCGTHFCWLCSTVVDDGAFPEHFRWWNLRGCANMQLDEGSEPKMCTILGAKLLSVFQIIVLGIPALVLAFGSMIMCPCFIPGCGRTNRERVVNCISFWGSFLSSMLLLPFTCLGMLLLSALYCFVAAIAFFVKAFSSRAGQGGGSNDSENAAVGTSRDINTRANGSGNAGSRDDLVRELESIFERMEEGISTSNSN